ncbi:MAG: universal stress protein [Bacteroidota bacterium]|nr:universal stress protein [Bacteroidota bacterium]
MKTILVPTDFSDTAKNAALCAIELGKQTGVHKLVLYNAYQTTVNVSGDPAIPALEVLDVEALKKASEEGLQNFKFQLLAFLPDNMQVETESEFNLLTPGIADACERHKVDLVVMGITGGGAIQENLFGSNTISVAKQTKTPVIIIPKEARLKNIHRVLLVCDFKQVVETTPVGPIKSILDETQAKFYVLNVDHNQRNFSADTPFESLMLDTLFHQYHPEYHFADDPDFIECINDFVVANQIDLIITIPKKHSFFESLFKRSHTKILAFHSHVPLMVIHE